jgi:NAD-dependent histone deacetylase SIR2
MIPGYDAEHRLLFSFVTYYPLYFTQANLARLKLDRPEDVFDIRFFRSNPYPFYALAKELYPGRHRPTITHSFVRLLETKGLLRTCFTQNIDTLERRAGISKEKLVEAHGSFASQSCIDCKAPFDAAEIRRLIQEERIPRCNRCRGLVKPDIVFFGESVSVLLPFVPLRFVS